MLPKVFLRTILFIAALVIIASAFIPGENPPPAEISPTSDTKTDISSPTYEIRLTGNSLYLYTFSEQGTELDRKTLEYIDLYSLRTSQIESLRKGEKFVSREAVAEFIQDLDS